MLKALVIKELREAAGIAALAALAGLLILADLTGTSLLPMTNMFGSGDFPFVSISFKLYMGWLVGLTAVALGLRQTVGESSRGTYHFLLHRPVSRGLVFGTKLAIGMAIVLALGALLIVAYAAWAAGEGNSPTPFYWSMTGPSWHLLMALSLVYLGAFLSGIRPARWFGSRLGPLVAAFVATMAVISIWWWAALPLVILFAFIGLVAIFHYAATRDI